MRKLLVLASILMAVVHAVYGQSANGGGDPSLQSKGLRNFFGNFSLHVGTGYGVTFYNHEINGPGILQLKDSTVFLFDNTYVISDTLSSAYMNWTHDAQASTNVVIGDEDYVVSTDTIPIKYTASGGNIPITVAVSYTYDRYRLGVGFTFEEILSTRYYPNHLFNDLQPFKTDYITSSMTRFYIYFGGEVFRSIRHTIAVDGQFGTFKFGKKHYNPNQVKPSVYFNLGVSFERSFSEYFKVFVRPNVELKNYNLTVPDLNYKINNGMPAFYLTVGAILRMPDLRKCPVSQCRTQKNHLHGDKLYRSKVHPFYKWQNPNYGQNYPQLIRYKGKNKRKINPY